jgi:hypothetical protein
LLATFGLLNVDLSMQTLIGATVLVLYTVAAWFQNGRRLPGWSLLGVGMLFGLGLPVVLALAALPVALATGTEPTPSSSPFTLAIPWVLLALLVLCLRRDVRFSPGVGLLAVGTILCSVLVRVKYFVLYGVSWAIAGEMLGVSLWAAGTLLLPAVVAGLLGRRYGLLAVLFAVGGAYVWYQVLLDNAQRVSAGITDPALYLVYVVATQLPFVVIGPWWFLRARGLRGRLWGLLISVCAAVSANILISGLVRRDFSPVIWLSAIPYTVSIALSIALAYALCQSRPVAERGDLPAPVAG